MEVLPYGVFVEHGFEMQEVYNGKTFPEYFASDEIVAAIEVQNQGRGHRISVSAYRYLFHEQGKGTIADAWIIWELEVTRYT